MHHERKLWRDLDNEQRRYHACATLLKNRKLDSLAYWVLDWTRSDEQRRLDFVRGLWALRDKRTAKVLASIVDQCAGGQPDETARAALKALLALRDRWWTIDFNQALQHEDPEVRRLARALQEAVVP